MVPTYCCFLLTYLYQAAQWCATLYYSTIKKFELLERLLEFLVIQSINLYILIWLWQGKYFDVLMTSEGLLISVNLLIQMCGAQIVTLSKINAYNKIET